MKAIKLEFGENTYHLVFNGMAMFDFDDKYGGATKLFDIVQKPGKNSFAALCESVATLAEQGELVRRNMGYDHGKIPSVDEIKAIATPLDAINMRVALLRAVTVGYGREIENNDEIDLGLVELSQKKTNV